MIEIPLRSGIVNAVIFITLDVILISIIRDDILTLYTTYLNWWVTKGGLVSYNNLTYGIGEAVDVVKAFPSGNTPPITSHLSSTKTVSHHPASIRDFRIVDTIFSRAVLMTTYLSINALLLMVALGVDGSVSERGIDPFTGNLMQLAKNNEIITYYHGSGGPCEDTSHLRYDYLSVKRTVGNYTCYAETLCQRDIDEPERVADVLSLKDCGPDKPVESLPLRQYILLHHRDAFIGHFISNPRFEPFDDVSDNVVTGYSSLSLVRSGSELNATIVCLTESDKLHKHFNDGACLAMAYDGEYQWIVQVSRAIISGINEHTLSSVGRGIGVKWKHSLRRREIIRLGVIFANQIDDWSVPTTAALADIVRARTLIAATNETATGYRATEEIVTTEVSGYSFIALCIAVGMAVFLRLTRITFRYFVPSTRTKFNCSVQGLAQATFDDHSVGETNFETGSKLKKGRLLYGIYNDGSSGEHDGRLRIVRN